MNLVAELIRESHLRRALPEPAVARLVRQRAGVTQAEIARVLGVDRVTVTRWETAAREPRGQLRLRYMELLEQLAAEATTDA